MWSGEKRQQEERPLSSNKRGRVDSDLKDLWKDLEKVTEKSIWFNNKQDEANANQESQRWLQSQISRQESQDREDQDWRGQRTEETKG